MKFRGAQQGDAEQIALLHANSWRQIYRGMMTDDFLDGDVISNRLQVWRDRLVQDRADQFVCLAEHGPHLAGFICAFGNEDAIWGSYIDNLHVTHEKKRIGIGAMLMKQAADWLNVRYPHSGIYLWVMEANVPARQFYERLGASNAGTVDKPDPAGGSAPNCRYVWTNPATLVDAIRNVILRRGRNHPVACGSSPPRK